MPTRGSDNFMTGGVGGGVVEGGGAAVLLLSLEQKSAGTGFRGKKSEHLWRESVPEY